MKVPSEAGVTYEAQVSSHRPQECPVGVGFAGRFGSRAFVNYTYRVHIAKQLTKLKSPANTSPV